MPELHLNQIFQTQAEFDLPVLCALTFDWCLEDLRSKAAIGGVFTMVMCYVMYACLCMHVTQYFVHSYRI